MHNACHGLELPGSCFKKYDGTPVALRHPFTPRLVVAIQFQALFTDLSVCFSTFAYATKFAIGLELYLALEVNDSRLHAAMPSDATLDTCTRGLLFAYAAVTL